MRMTVKPTMFVPSVNVTRPRCRWLRARLCQATSTGAGEPDRARWLVGAITALPALPETSQVCSFAVVPVCPSGRPVPDLKA